MRKSLKFFNTLSFGLLMSLSLLILSSCEDNSEQKNEEFLTYKASVKEWRDSRIISLKTNWLSLAGLFPLSEGENSFGFDDSNDIIFPNRKIPANLGSFFLENGEISVKINPDVEVTSNGEKVQKVKLLSDHEGEPTVLHFDSFRWFIIIRGDKEFVRLRDIENPIIAEFSGIESFQLDTLWKVKGQFEPHMTTKIIETATSNGGSSQISSTGAFGFRINGQYYRLDAWPIGKSGNFQTIYADETSGIETYGGGRFLIIEKVDYDGSYIIDFNKAYNPPCTFTEFATCPLPPPQNRLPIKVTAGEKKYQEGAH